MSELIGLPAWVVAIRFVVIILALIIGLSKLIRLMSSESKVLLKKKIYGIWNHYLIYFFFYLHNRYLENQYSFVIELRFLCNI